MTQTVTQAEYPGILLTEGEELLRRVVPPGKAQRTVGNKPSTPGAEAFKPELEPTAAAFQPGGRNSHDNGGLSTKREAEDPKDTYWAYLQVAEPPGSRTAVGTWGFKVGEANVLALPAYDDGGVDDDHPENHATVWFPMPERAAVSNARLKLLHDRIADDLRKYALAHGCLFWAEDPEADAKSLETTTE